MPPADQLQPSPFVLLDDARAVGAADARLYTHPVEIITAHDSQSLNDVMQRLGSAQHDGLHAAGYFTYEAGYALEPKLHELLPDDGRQLCWFGLFKDYEAMSPQDVQRWIANQTAVSGALYHCEPATDFQTYAKAYRSIQSAIVDGDIYQANLTFELSGHYSGHPLGIYADLRERAQAGYGGVIYDGTDWQLSFSPELFFTLYDGEITARPMKGTVKRQADPVADKKSARALQESIKDRAENLMIVDLLRNDISRVAQPGSVRVPKLFDIESYPTVHQMTSTVKAKLKPGYDAADILRATFPCGSITGAPKIRAMEILQALESRPRGVYCGSMGRIDSNGDAAFNVAIRTLYLDSDQKTATMGLGSAIVADSDAIGEWRECALKGAFVTKTMREFDLIETMAFDPAHGIERLEAHLKRMKDSAQTLGFEFDRHAARNTIQAVCFHAETASKVRLMLARSGAIAIEMQPIAKNLSEPARVALVPLPVGDDDIRLRHKTSDRAFYDEARRAVPDADEVVFTNESGELTEGSYTNIFVKSGNDWVTPPLELGLLPGILRQEMIDNGSAKEAVLTAADLAGEFCIGNSVRGLIPAKLISA